MELPQELHHFSTPAWNTTLDDVFFYTDNSSASLHYDYPPEPTPPYNNFTSLESFCFHQDFDPFQFESSLKRHKRCDCHKNSPLGIEVLPPLPEFQTAPPPIYQFGSCDVGVKKEPEHFGSVSAQSIAARQRRRKITEKTQELGKLVPGGPKMNTAEMLQAAYKYIKFLQAQVGILQFMNSYTLEEDEDFEGKEEEEELQTLIESTLIQEKLYNAEKCLVRQKFVEEMRNDEEIENWNPLLVPLVKQEHSS